MKSTIHTIKSRVANKTGLSEEFIVQYFKEYCEHVKELLANPEKQQVAVVWGTLELYRNKVKLLIGTLEKYRRLYEAKQISLYVVLRSLVPHDDFLSRLSKKEMKEFMETVGEEEILTILDHTITKYKTLIQEHEDRRLKKSEHRKHKRLLTRELQDASSQDGV